MPPSSHCPSVCSLGDQQPHCWHGSDSSICCIMGLFVPIWHLFPHSFSVLALVLPCIYWQYLGWCLWAFFLIFLGFFPLLFSLTASQLTAQCEALTSWHNQVFPFFTSFQMRISKQAAEILVSNPPSSRSCIFYYCNFHQTWARNHPFCFAEYSNHPWVLLMLPNGANN